MRDHLPNDEVSAQLNHLAREIYSELARQFPVCMASDEFHFFPQFKESRHGGVPWDDFSESAVQTFLIKASGWRARLQQLRSHSPGTAPETDIELLSRVLTTLAEQFRLVGCHKTQPTFYLTVLSIGLAEALERSRDDFGRRIDALPDFLNTATENLKQVPVVFADLAFEMLSGLRRWIMLLPLNEGERHTVLNAMTKFHDHVRSVRTSLDFRLQGDLYARVANFHMGCRMGLDEIERHLDVEIETSARLLAEAAGRISPDTPWQTVFHALPSPKASDRDIAALYQDGIHRLKSHCRENGFFLDDDLMGCDVAIQTIAEHMMPVRANAAYTMPPGHPPKGGVFYILPADRQTLPRDMLLLAAHETFPGHHLLDTLRWRLKAPLRRCLEFPLFYEGWACLGEEILFDTGFFSEPMDRLLLAKRRFWRAHRGRAELRIHTGRCRLKEAAMALADIGLVNREQALAMVRRYALKPGYQLSYAMGRMNFRRLYDAYTGQGHTPGEFVREALSEGEVGFDHLARRMLKKRGRPAAFSKKDDIVPPAY